MKMVKLFCATTLTLIASLMLMTPTAYADPAIIIVGGFCGVLDGDGNGFGTDDTRTVSSQNGKPGNLNVMLKCHSKKLQDRIHAPAGIQLGGRGPGPIAVEIIAEMQQYLAEHRGL